MPFVAAPEELAVGSPDSRHAGIGELDDLADAADFDEDRRGVVDAVGEAPCSARPAPRSSCSQRDEIALLAARHEDHLVAIHQGHPAEAPLRQLAAEILGVVLAPDLRAGGRVGTQHFTVLADGKDPIAVDGRRAAWSGKTAPARCARTFRPWSSRAFGRLPRLRAIR